MEKKQLIATAHNYFIDKGYFVARVSPARGIDLLVFSEDHKNKPIFVTVCDASKVKSIPLNGFGYSKRAKEKAARFVKACCNWRKAYCFSNEHEYDAVWVDGTACHHLMDINPLH